MQGHILIDAKLNRIALIDGTLQKDVSFGWGILGIWIGAVTFCSGRLTWGTNIGR